MADPEKPKTLREQYPDAAALMTELRSTIGDDSKKERRERLQTDRKRLFAEISVKPEKTPEDVAYLEALGGRTSK